MKKLLICLCLAWLIHFPGGNSLKVDSINWREEGTLRRSYFEAQKNGKLIIIPWYQVIYIEEVS